VVHLITNVYTKKVNAHLPVDLMNRNITLRAEKKLIHQAREKAAREKSTLNEQFRLWLERYVNAEHEAFDFPSLMQRLSYANSGKQFSRDELNGKATSLK
jgi:hypothetical protein